MRTLLKRSVLAALPLAAGLVLAGCGTGGGEPSADGSPSESREETALAFAECMRDNGVDMPDPNGSGSQEFALDEGVDQSDVDEAMKACEEFQQGGDAQADSDPDALAQRVEYAECMRENGVEEFPDPDPEQDGAREVEEGVAEDPELEQAVAECRSLQPGSGSTGAE